MIKTEEYQRVSLYSQINNGITTIIGDRQMGTNADGVAVAWSGAVDGDGKPHGNGLLWWAGGKYDGDFVNGKMHGTGTRTYPDGRTYVGDHVAGAAEGTGTYTWANGDKYVGAFVGGLHHGTGTKTLADGRQLTGTWANGSLT